MYLQVVKKKDSLRPAQTHVKTAPLVQLPLTLFRINLKLGPCKYTVAVVQLVERQIVILVVAGSSPVGHPIFHLKDNLPKS